MGKKAGKKVSPMDEDENDMSPEEKLAVAKARKLRIAEDYMNESHKTRLLKTYQVCDFI